MAHRLTAILVVLLGTIAPVDLAMPASASDPLQAPECTQALAALQHAEAAAASAAAAASSAHAVDPQLAAARKRAAQLCLATRADQPPAPGRFAQPPLAAPPVLGATAPPAPSSPVAATPARAPTQPPLVSITACDAAGCWTSHGTRLNRVGPTLWGSRGAYTVQGTIVRCP